MWWLLWPFGGAGWFVLARRCVGGVRVGVVCECVCGWWWVSRAATGREREKGVCWSAVFWLVCCLLCVVCCVGFGGVARASHLAHTLTHVGTVFDGRPQSVKLSLSPPPTPPPLCFSSVCWLRCVFVWWWWCLVVVLGVFVWGGVCWGGVWWVLVLCGGCCVVGAEQGGLCAYMCWWCAGWSGV